ncbi:MAG: hypothetical protein JSW00_13655 [Thermoplasmata archaeon]|nr:MAG: hypothetical protein JSW00_13655 [Thermoplasmata archaeon]
MVTITVYDVELALKNTLGKKGIEEEKIKKLAIYVMNFFGFSDTITDNLLKAKDRDVFYTLQDAGLLTTLQDQIRIKKGKLWRIHYWVLRKKEILRLSRLHNEVEQDNNYDKIYNELSNEVWRRGEIGH